MILLTANLNFETVLHGPKERAGKVCGDSQDLKSPGEFLLFTISLHARKLGKHQEKFYLLFEQEIQIWPKLMVYKVVMQCTNSFITSAMIKSMLDMPVSGSV